MNKAIDFSYTALLNNFLNEFDLDQCEHCPYQNGGCMGQCIDEDTLWDDEDDEEEDIDEI